LGSAGSAQTTLRLLVTHRLTLTFSMIPGYPQTRVSCGLRLARLSFDETLSRHWLTIGAR
jgi:hypothetical protein